MRSRDPLEEIHRWLVERGLAKYNDIIFDVLRVEHTPSVLVKLCVFMRGDSFLDIYWDTRNRYSLHYERRHIDGRVYRHENAHMRSTKHVKTWT